MPRCALHIDSWRWSGVPFYLRAGKRLPVTATEVVVELRPPPANVFGDSRAGAAQSPRFRVGPDVAIALGAHVKRPGPVMTGRERGALRRQQTEGEDMDAYAVLISAALIGDTSHFAREDEVEAAWAIVDPLLNLDDGALRVPPASWGPPQASDSHRPVRLAQPRRATAGLDALLRAGGAGAPIRDRVGTGWSVSRQPPPSRPLMPNGSSACSTQTPLIDGHNDLPWEIRERFRR